MLLFHSYKILSAYLSELELPHFPHFSHILSSTLGTFETVSASFFSTDRERERASLNVTSKDEFTETSRKNAKQLLLFRELGRKRRIIANRNEIYSRRGTKRWHARRFNSPIPVPFRIVSQNEVPFNVACGDARSSFVFDKSSRHPRLVARVQNTPGVSLTENHVHLPASRETERRGRMTILKNRRIIYFYINIFLYAKSEK